MKGGMKGWSMKRRLRQLFIEAMQIWFFFSRNRLKYILYPQNVSQQTVINKRLLKYFVQHNDMYQLYGPKKTNLRRTHSSALGTITWRMHVAWDSQYDCSYILTKRVTLWKTKIALDKVSRCNVRWASLQTRTFLPFRYTFASLHGTLTYGSEKIWPASGVNRRSFL